MATKVTVTGVSLSADTKTVTDFFSFCGRIQNISLFKQDNTSQTAIIEFESESAAKTALLLSNALIVDQAIAVAPFTDADADALASNPQSTVETSSSQIQQKEFHAPDDARSKTSVIASLLASGYVLADDAVAKARVVDEQNQISAKLAQLKDTVATNLSVMDQQYHISETANSLVGSFGEALGTAVRTIDQTFGVADKAAASRAYMAQQYEAVSANPNVRGAIDSVQGLSENVTSSVKPHWDATATSISSSLESIRQESNRLYEEKRGEAGGAAGGAAESGGEPASAAPAAQSTPGQSASDLLGLGDTPM
mmetsp:Transcript_6247/g.15836  ORF Transcript_6247/g.15836 Transcript_6247/m.15836 type:complete len:311 (+) Transcript_6247:58-990(+)